VAVSSLTAALSFIQVFHCHFLAHEDTGMMATLFIGQHQRKTARQWATDHVELLVGMALGVLVVSVLLVLMAVFFQQQGHHHQRTASYQHVEQMNELKAKAID
jgi:heme/copper-type cytochrome/quinol oxidase subunit 2